MLGSRMAMEKLQQMDEAYANAIGKALFNERMPQAVQSAAAQWTPLKRQYQTYSQLGKAVDQGVATRREVLGPGAMMSLRYAVPAAGIGLAGVGAASMMNNGSAHEIDYSSPAHGGNLSPESHAIYKEVHQGLMNGTVSSEELRAAVGSGKFDHDPLLVAHFMDVMG